LEAVENNNLEKVKILLERDKKQANSHRNGEASPLHIAASKGHLDIVKELLRNCTTVDYLDANGNTPRTVSALEGRAKVWECLMNNVETFDFKVTSRRPSRYQNVTSSVEILPNKVGVQSEENLTLGGITEAVLLGEGQFGQVWKGLLNQRTVAVKVLKDASTKNQEELVEELTMLG